MGRIDQDGLVVSGLLVWHANDDTIIGHGIEIESND